MSNIERHVVSLDLAKRLVEEGIEIESEFWWQEMEVGRDELGGPIRRWSLLRQIGLESGHAKWAKSAITVPAPLSSELGEMLPKHIVKDNEKVYRLTITARGDDYEILYRDLSDRGTLTIDAQMDQSVSAFLSKSYDQFPDYIREMDVTRDEKMTDAMAKMLIYLKREGLK